MCIYTLSSGGNHIGGACFHPVSVCLLRSRLDCAAEGSSCLRAVPVEAFSSSHQSPTSLCASSNRPADKTGKVRHALRLLWSSSGDQGASAPAGPSLPPFSLYLRSCRLQLFLGDTTPDCLRHLEVNMDGVCAWLRTVVLGAS